jgi:glutamate synthase (NADPH/NADH) large chain
MSGGVAYVYDPDGTFTQHCNPAMVTLERVAPEATQTQVELELAAAGKGRLLHAGRLDEPLLRDLIERHLRYTGSTRALSLLDHWEAARAKFIKVFQHEYRRALSEQHLAQVKAEKAVESRQKETA